MKRIMLRCMLAGMAGIFLLPAMAQNDKDKVVEKVVEKDKKEQEQIVIRRDGNEKGKMVIEIDGDKITINGKVMKEGEGTVTRQRIKDPLSFYMRTPGAVSVNGDGFRLFHEDANHAMLGVTTEKAENGAKVKSVTAESAAEKIGLKEGDIITHINETAIADPDALSKAIRAQKPGDNVKVSYLRDGKKQTANAELTKWKGAFKFDMDNLNFDFDINTPGVPQAPRRVMPGQAFSWNNNQPRLGISVQDTEEGKGVKVIEVEPDSHAAKAGVKENDVIQEIDGRAIDNTDQVVKMIRESREKASIKLKVDRGGKSQQIEVKMPKKIKSADL